MKVTQYQSQNLHGLKQALGMMNLNKAMKMDQQSMNDIVKMMEQSATPHKGSRVDIKL